MSTAPRGTPEDGAAPGRRVVERLRRAPAPVAGLAISGAGTAVLTLFDRVVEDEFSWSEVALRLVVLAAVCTLVVLRARRRAAVPGIEAGERAVHTGTLPDDVDPADLHAGLGYVRRRVRLVRWAAPAVLAVLVLAWVLFIDRSSVGDGSWWLVPVGGVALAGGLSASAEWQLRRTDRLLGQLAARPPATDAT